ncbi:DUF465 domain-containing protein [Propionivibrio sp.]|uniref:YdcH family protein n=1 Tax=Propionivibrio sp. TaxID=2212460 RepID=UPI002632691B|nr:DUF465 domain-containing protein [Propionivibrio sp.]
MRCYIILTGHQDCHFVTTLAVQWVGQDQREGTIMQVDHHELHREFPEFLDVMQVLRTSDSSFSQMFDEYHNLTSQVERLEEEDVPVDDFTIEEMKKVRVRLKDKMYKLLVAHKNSN